MYDVLWDKALNLASVAVATVAKALRQLTLLTGIQPEMVIAAAMGGLIFILALKFFFAATK